MIVEGTTEESMRSFWELFCNALKKKKKTKKQQPWYTCFITSFLFFCVSVIVEISVCPRPIRNRLHEQVWCRMSEWDVSSTEWLLHLQKP